MDSLLEIQYSDIENVLAATRPVLALVGLIAISLVLTLLLARRASRRNTTPAHLAVLREAAENISSQEDRQEIIRTTLSSASTATGADYAVLALDRSGETSTNFYYMSNGQMRVERVGLAPSDPTTKNAAKAKSERKGVPASDYRPRCLIPSHYPPLRSAAGRQIQTSYGDVGELFVANKSGGFTAADEAAVALLANQVTQHLEYKEVLQQIKRGYMETIEALVNAVEAKDAYTRGHSDRVIRYAVAAAKEMGLPAEQVEEIRIGAVLHDIGKIGVPENIINKPGRLDDEEWRLMKEHPRMATKIIDSFNRSREILLMIYHHHEMYDGTGYPAGLTGNDIPLAARILKVADAFEAMTSKRPYQKTKTSDEAAQELKNWSGRQFDPLVTSAFLRALHGRLHGLDEIDL